MLEHWHVHIKDDEDDPIVTTDPYVALDHLADELSERRSFHYQGISAHGDDGNFKEAYWSFQAYEKIARIQESAENVVKQHKLRMPERAPLFRDWCKNQYSAGLLRGKPSYGDYMLSSPLWQTALWIMEQINSDTPFEIYSCKSDDVISDDEGYLHETYSASGM